MKTGIVHYDLSFLKEMEDDDYMKEVIGLFLESAPATLHAIKTAVENEDWQNIYRKAHKLKSSLGLFQMDLLLEQVTAIENYGKAEQDIASVKKALEDALSEYEIISVMLEKELQ